MINLTDLPLAFGHRELRRYLPSLGRQARRKLIAQFGVDISGKRLVPTTEILVLLEKEQRGTDEKNAA